MWNIRDWPLPGPDALTMDLNDVAKFLKVNVSTLRRWIKAGQFPPGQLMGGEASWTGADIAAFIHLRGRMSAEGESGDAHKQANEGIE